MKSLFRIFIALPTPFRSLIGVLMCTSLIGLVYMIFPSMLAVWGLVIGCVLMVVLVVLYVLVLRALDRRKAAPLAQGIIDNSTAAPTAVSDPSHRAKLDELARSFSMGVEKFQAAGKNIYAVPWYLLAGEPGSGKTEAIRRSQVGFPRGFQDTLQGAGGTLNMNWWFTNDAVILDTAGRLMFDDVPPGTTSEWQAFLKLLKTHRRNCPINGMLLVIPADSLISDSNEELCRKSQKIAQQLEEIQRTLDVRFPVFVVITKCDLINGFREFFDPLRDHQHQMIGWSNPASLDQPFDPQLVDQHFESIRDRLRHRRYRLLKDPIHTEDPVGRRIDQVDALYEFPDAVTRLGPPLKQYLEAIFVPGNWSPKPLFLRGIYFTSSMREGQALDAILAEALGVSVESLPDGRGWDRERAYFLRDLFLNKVFRERGLVTRASNTKRLLRRRGAVLLLAGMVGVLVLAGLTWFGRARLRSSIGTQRGYWRLVAEHYAGDRPADLSVIGEEGHRGSLRFVFRGSDDLKGFGQPMTVGRFPEACQQMAAADMQIPWIFRPATSMSGLNGDRAEAMGRIYNAAVLWPLADGARRKMRADRGQRWSPQATDTLVQLIRIEAIATVGSKRVGPDPQGHILDLASMLRYILPKGMADTATVTQDLPALQSTLAWIDRHHREGRWPAVALEPGSDGAQSAVEVGVTAFLENWQETASGIDSRWAVALNLWEGLSQFANAEQRLLAVDDQVEESVGALTDAQLRPRLAAWKQAMADLRRAKKIIDPAFEQLAPQLQQKPLKAVFLDSVTEAIVASEAVFDELRSKLRLAASNGNQIYTQLAQHLDDQRQRIKHQITERGQDAVQRLPKLAGVLLGQPTGQTDRFYQLRYRMYQLTDQQLVAEDPRVDLLVLGQADDTVQRAIEQTDHQVRVISQRAPGVSIFSEAGRACQFVLSQADHRRRRHLAQQTAVHAPQDYDQLIALIGRYADQVVLMDRPRLLMTAAADGGQYDQRFDPSLAARLFGAQVLMTDYGVFDDGEIPDDGVAGPMVQPVAMERYLEQYRQDYCYYWSTTVRQREGVPGRSRDWTWSEFREQLHDMEVFHVNQQLIEFTEQIRDALRVTVDTPAACPDSSGLLDTLVQEIKLLRSDPFAQICYAANDLWRGLESDEDTARRRLLAMPASSFANEYLEPYIEGAGVPYWNGFYLTALRALASSAETEAGAALNKLIHDHKRFPLVPVDEQSDPLSYEEMQEAYRLSQKIQTLVATDTPLHPDRTVGQGGRTKYQGINQQLDRLLGTTLLKEQGEQWFGRVAAVLQALAPSEGPLSCKVYTPTKSDQLNLPSDDDWGRNAVHYFRFLEVKSDGPGPFHRVNADRVAVAGRFSVGDGGLQVVFYEHLESEEARGHVTFASPWGPIRAVRRPEAVHDSGTGRFRVPLVFQDAGGQRFYFWIELEFSRPLPIKEHWPNQAIWPKH